MKRILLVALVTLLTLVAVAAEKLLFSGTIAGWNNDTMDTITFVQPGPWGGKYDVVQVETVDMSKTEITGKEKAKAAAEEAAKLMDSWCQAAVRAGYTGGPLKIVSTDEAASLSEGRVLVLRWQCDAIDPGSRATRFWVGFGAGHGGVTMSGVLIDKSSGEELVKFTHRRLSGRGMAPSGGIYAHVLEEAGSGIGNDVGRMLAIVTRTRPAS